MKAQAGPMLVINMTRIAPGHSSIRDDKGKRYFEEAEAPEPTAAAIVRFGRVLSGFVEVSRVQGLGRLRADGLEGPALESLVLLLPPISPKDPGSSEPLI